MLNLEQVKLLETKVARAVEYVEQLCGDNAALVGENARLLQQEAALLHKEAELQARLESYQKRIDELEVAVMRFKEEQGRIEDGILAALDRLNQFENTIEKTLKEKYVKPAAAPKAASAPPPARPAPPEKPVESADGSGEEIFFEIEGEAADDDIEDPLAEIDAAAENSSGEDGELDIF
ncbi:MAG: cell division protein ZapB [Treponema sp.]|jgi:hypothetical protein|nr:cell division protein ZapB [Treponema sp.]